MSEVPVGERLVALETRIEAVHQDIHAMWEGINRVSSSMDALRDKFGQRPSWAVSVILTVLTSAVSALSVALVVGH